MKDESLLKTQCVSTVYKNLLYFQHPDSFSMIFLTLNLTFNLTLNLIFVQPGYYFLNQWIDLVGMIFSKVYAAELSIMQITLHILIYSLL